ncbi:MAG TPA: 30S ribosomal protein S7 [Candidatus Peribacter riflensis]|uniref:Small ribosomal subunit protein uS7 n=1 Tax=Candidatus Peribacter riflensis TaxID=1735162 RepID=A0A0S1SN48_9BACT|nr:MAG: small subunit ribosomal protein S7 [Candidatus Peribacter riflensis]OGJ78230.1 MAG: 30S ribosomal protein S7 [Candidatus Peribacteria bacterium RIFOXYB1_FULL_57_12]ALM10752.1 MAG: small subunit ribosomal protein S7 [Candidatus Peribacter riflensis]ALM11854.1 MAG: small subunit ribosomal protein S7 [Candidatus Peribacter riflensis]ALM12957.1 MAG: small subunit ribosomal protein S7 [Candidatus Peribacter riflensis]
MPKPIKSYIPEGSDPLIEKFICCLMKRGKKSTARRVFWDAIEVVKGRTKDQPLEVFQKALLNVTPLVEVRPKRVAGAVYQVPVEVNPHRQQTLSIRWLLIAARSRKGMPMSQRLGLELLDASSGQGAAVKKKEDVLRMAQANKAFAHLAK